ncbi:unnamed protein product [Microthlaspi erraticum]|uniref:Uncharacterized protein n=1 Tax=Microthlaspi erraticum TaxID=1685480 RepID=A0A6D2J240_9BRAS|nr:unnamed protein product [Microthlaspi erraticum]
MFDDKTILKVHCYSGNDDFDVLLLRNREAKFWRFNDRWFGETIFSCDLNYGFHFMHHKKFRSYESKWNHSNGNKANVTWLAVERGLYRVYEHRTPEFMHEWE